MNDTPDNEIEFPFQHPAAVEVKTIFLNLDVRSEDDYRALPRRDRYVWDISWFEAEVMNGGIHQYLANSSGDHAAACVEALTDIGATNALALLTNATELFPKGGPSKDRTEREAQLHEIEGEAADIDDMVEGEIEGNLYELLLDAYRRMDSCAM
jgi:hypothetical protein